LDKYGRVYFVIVYSKIAAIYHLQYRHMLLIPESNAQNYQFTTPNNIYDNY